MGGKGKKRKASKQQQPQQHKVRNKSHAETEFSETNVAVVLKGRSGKSLPVPVSNNTLSLTEL